MRCKVIIKTLIFSIKKLDLINKIKNILKLFTAKIFYFRFNKKIQIIKIVN